MISVTFRKRTYTVPEGTPVAEIIGRTYIEEHGVLGATVDNHLVSLETPIDADAQLGVVTCQDREGEAILRRTSTHCLHYLFARDFPSWRFRIGQSLMGGYFYEVFAPEDTPVDLEALASHLDQALAAASAARMPLQRARVSIQAAHRRLTDPFGYKARLLEAWTGASVPVIGLGEFVDIQHGPYAPDTGCVRARVIPYPPGLILQFEPKEPNGSRLYKAYREARDWNELVGISTVGDLNSAALQDRIQEVVGLSEALHEKRIAAIADEIARKRPRVVLVAGPSSSGKTTFIKRLGVQLRVNGLEPLQLSLDDYYLPRKDRVLGADGQIDYEAFEALDLPLWHSQVAALLAGREVRLPRYDFVRGQRRDSEGQPPVNLGPDQLLLVEGIHGLNPRLLDGQPAFRIFISALTQLVIDEHNRIFTSDSRLLRRIVRDRRYRGVRAATTLERWPAVRGGEDVNIFPYQESADAIFNSTLIYETAVLRPMASRYLLEVPRSDPARVRAYSLLKFLELFVPVFPDCVPSNSILREFVGGGSFQY